MTRRLRVAIATTGRFHVLDLARGTSESPASALFRLAPDSLALPALAGFAPTILPSVREWALYKCLNQGVMTRLRACGLFIGMFGMHLSVRPSS
jgi:hypothetical protein